MKLSPFPHLLALPPQGGQEVTEGADALQLNDKQEQQEDCALHCKGHQEASHTRLRHGEVVCLVL